MSFNIITDDNDIMTDNQIADLRQEMENYAKCMKGHKERIEELTYIGLASGHMRFPDACEFVSRQTLIKIGEDFMYRVYKGTRVDGTPNNWSVGFMGSRWLDMEGEIYGVDSIRAAFYSKKYYTKHTGKKWTFEKPYAITITVEKEKKG